ncbi:prepilin-type N-terminal cleavage/methylation domain-containing protein [Rubripirellula amarantea]|nr:prepilin-type N-terminal cleavage/methylation domain-containing protein [Rubripirellula amarantea]
MSRSAQIRSTAFTLVELLIAMTITLLLMAALARSFATIGKSINSGRAQVGLSGELRDISFRLRTDLRSMTVDAKPPIKSVSGLGYFAYYEGPLTESTFAMYGAEPTRADSAGNPVPFANANFNNVTTPTYRRFSKFGDVDDYVAFTAQAPEGEWFTGRVPRYLVDLGAPVWTDTNGDGIAQASEVDQNLAMEPVTIRSRYAEIVTWAAPKWQVNPADQELQYAGHPSAMPLYLDQNNDYIPDEMVLHQRVLLIRPDLNTNVDLILTGGTEPNFSAQSLRPIGNTADVTAIPNALRSIYPIGQANGGYSSRFPNLVHPTTIGTGADNRFMFESNWLVGMAPLHQFYDLSLRRILHPVTGEATAYVAANSLEDLVQPHNRFAHVRYPGEYFGRNVSTARDAYSMPLLATGWNDTILRWQGTSDSRGGSATAPTWFPTAPPSFLTLNNASAPVSRSGLFNGWLLPHFELGDPNNYGASANEIVGTGDHWMRNYMPATGVPFDIRWDRTGEDIIASSILSFDVKGYDPTAPVFITSGEDGGPGRFGIDDDGAPVVGTPTTNGNAVDETRYLYNGNTGLYEYATELGADGSDDVVVRVSDLAISNLMAIDVLDTRPQLPIAANTPQTYGATANVNNEALSSLGDFVDLGFPYLPGTALLNRTAEAGPHPTRPQVGRTTITNVINNYDRYMQTALSLFPLPTPQGDTATTPPTPAGMSSIKRSGKLVHSAPTTAEICFFQPMYDTWTDYYERDGFDQTHTFSGDVTSSGADPEMGTVWLLNDFNGNPRVLAPTVPQNAFQVDTGRLGSQYSETSPPFALELPAISISIRLEDKGSQEMTEFTIVEQLQ